MLGTITVLLRIGLRMHRNRVQKLVALKIWVSGQGISISPEVSGGKRMETRYIETPRVLSHV